MTEISTQQHLSQEKTQFDPDRGSKKLIPSLDGKY